MKSPTEFQDKVMGLRLAASKIYDDAVAAGIDPQEIQKTIQPLQEALAKTFHHAAYHDIPGCVLASDYFEACANTLEEQATRLLKKSAEALHYADAIKAELVARMESEGKETLHHGEFTVTLVVHADGSKSASLR